MIFFSEIQRRVYDIFDRYQDMNEYMPLSPDTTSLLIFYKLLKGKGLPICWCVQMHVEAFCRQRRATSRVLPALVFARS